MDFLVCAPELATGQLRALVSVARAARSGLAAPQRAMVEAARQLVFRLDVDVAALPAIEAEVLARHTGDPGTARQLVRLMIATSLADGPPSAQQMSLMRSFARAVGVDEPALSVVRHLAAGRLRRFRLAFLRRSHLRIYLRNTRRLLGGVRPMLRGLLVARGVLPEDAAMVERFRALAALPEDTFGHRFHHHCRREGLPFPGEKGGFPLGALFHDASHVLAGYDTSPEGELRNAAFQAGFTRGPEDFFTMLFAIVIHTAGVNLAPFPMPVQPGRIAQGGLAREVLDALRRGAAMPVDLGGDWDFWAFAPLPLEVARRRLGISPPAAVAA